MRGPAIIGAGTRVVDSYVGPFTAIARDCAVLGSEVEHSVLLDHTRLVNIGRLEDSLVGREVEITRTERRPRATRLMVGDHCQIDLS